MKSSLVLRNARQLPLYVIMSLLAIPFVFPFLWMFSSSLKTPLDIFTYPPALIPADPQWNNFVEAFQFQPLGRQFFNSVYIAVIVTVGTLIIASLAGYAFARVRFPLRSLLFLLLLLGLMMPAEVTIIPNYLLMGSLNLLNSHVPLIVIPLFGANAIVGTFLMRQSFLSFPQDLEDAAMLDGLGRFGIYWRIALPLAGPTLATVGILTFLSSWNGFIEPLVFLSDRELFTIPLALGNFVDHYGTPLWHLQLAATTVSVLPVLIVYFFAQRYVINSFINSGLKG
ncbi:MAG: carbohydrate ABC transporter permease [Chloroflexi bacterium]|nr:carbohydrate ABC transporter permease [Chloroflexota bacterium]